MPTTETTATPLAPPSRCCRWDGGLRILEVLFAWGIGLVFLYAALSKLVVMPEVSFSSQSKWGVAIKVPENVGQLVPTQDFVKAIRNYRMLPAWTERVMGVTLPWMEIAASIALMTRRYRREGAWILGGMLVMFIVAIGTALARGLDIACGCFSVAAQAKHMGAMTLIFDVILLACIVFILWNLAREKRRAVMSG